MISIIGDFYKISYILSFFWGVAVFILSIRMQMNAGTGSISVIYAPLLSVFVALCPLLFFQDMQNPPVLAWSFCILLIAKIVIYVVAFRFDFGYLWAMKRIFLILHFTACLLSTMWSARSVELMVALFEDNPGVLLRIIIVIAGIIYTIAYFVLDIYLLTKLIESVERKPVTRGGGAFLEKHLSSENVNTRRKVMSKLNVIKEERAWQLLIWMASNDRDANLRSEARKMAERKDLPPELLAQLEAIPQETSPVTTPQPPQPDHSQYTAPHQPAAYTAPTSPPQAPPEYSQYTAPQQPAAYTAPPSPPPQAPTGHAQNPPQQHAGFCTSCGNPLNGQESFCSQCGHRVSRVIGS